MAENHGNSQSFNAETCYQGQWNVRRPSDGRIPEENLNIIWHIL
jgi:hypothetical protein